MLGKLTLKNVLYAPKLGPNLISVNAITREVNGKVCLGTTHGVIKNRFGVPMAAATFEEEIGLYWLLEDTSTVTSIVVTATTKRTNSDTVANTSNINLGISQSASVLDWHRRFGHVSAVSIKFMARQSPADGPSADSADGKVDRESCILAKQMLMHHRTPSRPTSEPLELIHLD